MTYFLFTNQLLFIGTAELLLIGGIALLLFGGKTARNDAWIGTRR